MKPRILFATALALVAFAAPAAFQPASAREQMTDDEMEAARGGILVAGNLAFQFGAVVKTFEDGVLALQTQVTWTPDGPQVSQVAGQDVARASDQMLTALNSSLASSLGGPAGKTPQSVYVTSSGAALVQQVAQNQLVNLVMNTESNHDFRLDTNVTLVLPGFAATQANIAQQLTGLQLADEIHSAMNAAGH